MKKNIAYKGFSVDQNNQLNCRGFKFEVGNTYAHNGKIELCASGFHFCWNLNDVHDYYNLIDNVICEVEILGEIINQPDMKKSVTNKIKVLKILTKEEVFKISNTGIDNTGVINSGDGNSGNRNSGDGNSGDGNNGNRNSGDGNNGNRNSGDGNSGNGNSGNRNSGDGNSGNRNSGDRNSGNRNSGDGNSGDGNSGDGNSGDGNSGNWNSGNRNSGNRNSGDGNSGDGNSGDGNSGDGNSGNWNSGNRNSGNWNSGDYGFGIFNTKNCECYLFNQKTNMTLKDFYDSKYYEAMTSEWLELTEWICYTEEEKQNDKAKELIGGYLKQYNYKDVCKVWWDKLTQNNKDIILSMPNFDKNIFFEITGIIV